jgi:formylglycine-generating enzyme required for sulfatase activity
MGVIGYQALTGDLAQHPPSADHCVERLVGLGTPRPLADTVRRCLHKDPTQRLKDSAELADQLASLACDWPARVSTLATTTKVTKNSLGMKLAVSPAGSFVMGSPDTERDRLPHEGPCHPVRITRSFSIGVFPVTVGEFRQFSQATRYRTTVQVSGAGAYRWTNSAWKMDPTCTWQNPGFYQDDNYPVVCVSWNDAVAFCRWLSRCEGRIYRLPTEAEWEYCCRAGTSTATAFGDSLSAYQANFNGNFPYGGAPVGASPQCTSPVGAYQPNPWGLFDMHGNVWEWCADWYDANYYRESPPEDPRGPEGSNKCVLRGGSWFSEGKVCRSAARLYWLAPDLQIYNYLGFRVVCESP